MASSPTRTHGAAEPGARLVNAVAALRRADQTLALGAAREYTAESWNSFTDIVQRYGVEHEAVSPLISAWRAVEHHGMDPLEVAAFAKRDIPDGIVVAICGAGLNRGEIADLVQGRVRPDGRALAVMASLRGVPVPALDAQGDPHAAIPLGAAHG